MTSDQDPGETREKCIGAGRGRPVVMGAQERRRIVLDALDGLFAAGGMAGLTMSAVARSAGMSKRTLYELFTDRDQMLLAYLDRLVVHCMRPLSPEEIALPLGERLARILRVDLQPRGSGWDLPLAILRLGIGAEGSRVGVRCLEMGPRRMEAMLRTELERAQDRGEVAPGHDAAALAAVLRDMVQVPVIDALMDAGFRPTPEEGQARVDLALGLFLRGLGVTPA